MKKITIVNRHYPPNINITGENAWDLANYLINTKGIDVAVVHIERSFEGGGNIRKPVGKIHSIKTLYQGKNRILSYLSGFLDGYQLIKKAASLNHGPVIVMTSPPLLPFWASRILGKKKKDWILWSMDLFPEGFAASGEISASNFLYKYILKQTYKHSPSKIIALGPKQKAALEEKYNATIEGLILPCGVFMDQQRSEALPSWKTESGKIFFGYCGNCANPHSASFIKTVISCIDPSKHHFILAIYGSKAKEVLDFATGRTGLTILNNVPRADLHHIDIHLVSLVNSWTHVAVPSKAVSSVCSGSPFLFCGNPESDNWYLLQNAGWLIEENSHQDTAIKRVMDSISHEEIQQKKIQAAEIALGLNSMVIKAYDTIATWAR